MVWSTEGELQVDRDRQLGAGHGHRGPVNFHGDGRWVTEPYPGRARHREVHARLERALVDDLAQRAVGSRPRASKGRWR